MESDFKHKLIIGIVASFLMLLVFLYIAVEQTNLSWNTIGSIFLITAFASPIIVIHVVLQTYIKQLIARTKSQHPKIWEQLKNDGKIFPLLDSNEGPRSFNRLFFHTPVQVFGVAGKTLATPAPSWILLRPFAATKAAKAIVHVIPKDEQLNYLARKIERSAQLFIVFFCVTAVSYSILFYWLQH